MRKLLSVFFLICLILASVILALYFFRVPLANNFLKSYNIRFEGFNIAGAGFSEIALKNIKITDFNSSGLIQIDKIKINFKNKTIHADYAEIKLKKLLDTLNLPEEKSSFDYEINFINADIFYDDVFFKLSGFYYFEDSVRTAFYFNEGKGSLTLNAAKENIYNFKTDYAGIFSAEGEADLLAKNIKFQAFASGHSAVFEADYSEYINFKAFYGEYAVLGSYKDKKLTARSGNSGADINIEAFMKDEKAEFSGNAGEISFKGEVNLNEKYAGAEFSLDEKNITALINFSTPRAPLKYAVLYEDYEIEGDYLNGVLTARTGFNGKKAELTAHLQDETVNFTGNMDGDIKINGALAINKKRAEFDFIYKGQEIKASVDFLKDIKFAFLYAGYEIKGNYLNGAARASSKINNKDTFFFIDLTGEKIKFLVQADGGIKITGSSDLKNKKAVFSAEYLSYKIKNNADFNDGVVLISSYEKNKVITTYSEKKLRIDGNLFGEKISAAFFIDEKIKGAGRWGGFELRGINYFNGRVTISGIEKDGYFLNGVSLDLEKGVLTALDASGYLKNIKITNALDSYKLSKISFDYDGEPLFFSFIKDGDRLILKSEDLNAVYDLEQKLLSLNLDDLRAELTADYGKNRLEGDIFYFLKNDTAVLSGTVINKKGVYAEKLKSSFLKAERINYDFSGDTLTAALFEIYGAAFQRLAAAPLRKNPKINFIYGGSAVNASILKKGDAYVLNLNKCEIGGIDFSASSLTVTEENKKYKLAGKLELFSGGIYIIKRFQGVFDAAAYALNLNTLNSDFVLNYAKDGMKAVFDNFKGINFFLNGSLNYKAEDLNLKISELKIKDITASDLSAEAGNEKWEFLTGNINFVGVDIKDIEMSGRIDAQKIIAEKIKGNLLGGDFIGRGSVDIASSQAACDINFNGISVKAATALTPEYEDSITGLIDGNLKLLINGLDADKLKGTGDFNARASQYEPKRVSWKFLESTGGDDLKIMLEKRKLIPFIPKDYIPYRSGSLKFSLENGNIVFYKMELDVSQWYLNLKIQVAPGANSTEIMGLYDTLKNLSASPPKVDIF